LGCAYVHSGSEFTRGKHMHLWCCYAFVKWKTTQFSVH
jgi:hypothetical protein